MGLNIAMLRNFRLFADVATQDLLTLINKERQRSGLNVLSENTKLDQAAFLKAQDMVKNNYFDHYSPQGVSPWYWFDQAGYYYQYAGENLAMNFFDSNEAVTAWMNSPLHKENILNKNYTETGIAIVKTTVPGTNEEKIILVQTFGSQYKGKIAVAKTITTTKPTVTQRTTTTTRPLTTTTKKQEITTTTIQNEVLGLAQTQTNLPPADIRSKEEIEVAINQTPISKEQRDALARQEFVRTAFTNDVPKETWLGYQITSIFSNSIFKTVNQGSGIALIFLSTIGLFSIGKPKELSFGTKKILYTRNAILGAMGAGFLIIQPSVMFGGTIIPKILN